MQNQRYLTDQTFLTSATPAGLFMTHDGGYFLVAEDNLGKRAIVLRDEEDPSFSYRMLDEKPIAFGWWEPVMGFLVKASGETTEGLGILNYEGFELTLCCFSAAGEIEWVPLGFGETPLFTEHEIYDEWELLTVSRPNLCKHKVNAEEKPHRFVPRQIRIGLSLFEVAPDTRGLPGSKAALNAIS